MTPFIEAVLFLCLLGAAVALVRWLVKLSTTRRVQAANTDEIIDQVKYTCPVHGEFAAWNAVLFTDNPCPTCYRERLLAERNTTKTTT